METSPSLRQRKKAALRHSILSASEAAFLRKGYEAARVEDIAADVGISVPTFYNYFPSKEVVLQTLVRQSLHDWALLVLNKKPGRGSVRAQLRSFYRKVAGAMLENADLWRAAARADVLNFTRWPEQLEAEAAEHSLLERILSIGQTQGEVTTRFKPVRLARYLISMQDHLCWEWATHASDNPDGFDLEKELLRGVDFFSREPRSIPEIQTGSCDRGGAKPIRTEP